MEKEIATDAYRHEDVRTFARRFGQMMKAKPQCDTANCSRTATGLRREAGRLVFRCAVHGGDRNARLEALLTETREQMRESP